MYQDSTINRLPRIRAAMAAWAVLSGLCQQASAVSPTPQEMETAKQFAAEKLFSVEPATLPFSFTYGGKPSSELLQIVAASGDERDPGCRPARKRTVVYTDPQTGLQVRCEAVEYQDFPDGRMDAVLPQHGGQPSRRSWRTSRRWTPRGNAAARPEFLLHHAAGSQANRSDYGPRETPLPPKATATFAGAGGRPTNVDWSYFNLQWGDEGVIIVVGWPGQWAGEFVRDEARGLRVRAGQELVRTKLLPGEEIRSPLMVLQFWRGD